MLFSSFPDDYAMAVGPVAPPVTSGVDLTKSPFKQCGAKEINTDAGYYEERCDTGIHGRYMYIFIKQQEPSVLNICEIFIAGASKCPTLKRYQLLNRKLHPVNSMFSFKLLDTNVAWLYQINPL